MSIRGAPCAIQWIVIYPVDSVIHLLNNLGQMLQCYFYAQDFHSDSVCKWVAPKVCKTDGPSKKLERCLTVKLNSFTAIYFFSFNYCLTPLIIVT